MTTTNRSRSTSLMAIAAVALLVGACGAAAPSGSPNASVAASPSPTASAVETASPPPTEEPTTSPSASPDETTGPSASSGGADPSEDLTIGAPYELAPLDPTTADALETGLTKGLGAMAEVVDVGALEVRKDGTEAGFLIAMAFPDFPGVEDPAFFKSVMQGAAGSSGGTVTETTIGGKTVGLLEAPGTSFAAYQEGDTIIMAFAADPDEVTGIITALIEANG